MFIDFIQNECNDFTLADKCMTDCIIPCFVFDKWKGKLNVLILNVCLKFSTFGSCIGNKVFTLVFQVRKLVWISLRYLLRWTETRCFILFFTDNKWTNQCMDKLSVQIETSMQKTLNQLNMPSKIVAYYSN